MGGLHRRDALAMHVPGVTRWREQRAAGAGMHRHVDAEEVPDHDCVVCGGLQRGVAGDRRDAEQVGVASGHDHRNCVVVARVAVEDDGETVGPWCHDRQSLSPLPSRGDVETMVVADGRRRAGRQLCFLRFLRITDLVASSRRGTRSRGRDSAHSRHPGADRGARPHCR